MIFSEFWWGWAFGIGTVVVGFFVGEVVYAWRWRRQKQLMKMMGLEEWDGTADE